MKVRIKLKHLILFVFVCIIVITVITPYMIYKRAEMISQSDPITANLLYEKYIKLVPFGENRAKALYNIAENISPYENLVSYNNFHSFGSGSTGIPLTKEALELGEKYYSEIVNKYDNTEYASSAYKKLVDFKIAQCDISSVDNLIVEGMNSNNNDIKKLALKYELFNLIVRKKYDSAEKGCFSYLENNGEDADVYRVLSDIYYFKGYFDDSKKFIEKAREENIKTINNGNKQIEKFNSIYPVLSEQPTSYNFIKSNSIDLAKAVYNGSSTIKGKVKNKNIGIPYVIVILKDSRNGSLNEWSSVIDGNFVYTDENGNFEFDNLSKGEYSIEVRIPSMFFLNNEVVISSSDFDEGWMNIDISETKELNICFNSVIKVLEPKGIVEPINDEVKVKWEAYSNASYYKVEMISFENPVSLSGSRSQVIVSDKVYNTEYTILMDEIKHMNLGFSINGEGIISPQAFFGYSYPGSILPLVISAYNDNNEKISTSLSIISQFNDISAIELNDDNMINADKLVLEGKVREATAEYEKYLEENLEDIRVLTILTRIYSIGYKRDTEKGIYIGHDKEKAVEIAEKVYKLTKDPSILKFVYNRFDSDLKESDELIWAEDKINELSEEIKDTSIYITLANIQLKLKNFEKANQYFNTAKEKEGFYISDRDIMTKLYLKEFREALNIATLEEYKIYNGNKENFIMCLKEINNKTLDKDDEKAFSSIMELLLVNNRYIDNESIIKEYNTLKQNIEDEDILNLMREYERILYID